MLTPTIVTLKCSKLLGGLVFTTENYSNLSFECTFDGNDVKLSICIPGTKVLTSLHLVKGLLHTHSNFKELLFHEYTKLKEKRIRNIVFYSTSGYKFVVDANSDVDKLMKEYYRFYNYEVHDEDSEDEIVEREKRRLMRVAEEKRKAYEAAFGIPS